MMQTLESRILQSSLVPVRDELQVLEGRPTADKARSLVDGWRTTIALVQSFKSDANAKVERGIEAGRFAIFLRGESTAIGEWLLLAQEIQQAVNQAAEPFPDREKCANIVEEGVQFTRQVHDELSSLLRLAEKKGPPLDPA